MTVSVVIPFRAGDEARERALAWVTDRFRDAFPDVDIVLGSCNPDLPFNRSEAILDGARKTNADVLIVADGDCWSDGTAAAVEAVEGEWAWAKPHILLRRLNERASRRVLDGEATFDEMLSGRDCWSEKPYKGHDAGTLLVIRRDVLFDVPPDVRMIGWGQEDDAWGLALHLLVGRPWYGFADCWHLWHPPQPRRSRGIGNDQNLALYKRYRLARNDPKRMRDLVEAGKAVTAATRTPAAIRGE